MTDDYLSADWMRTEFPRHQQAYYEGYLDERLAVIVGEVQVTPIDRVREEREQRVVAMGSPKVVRFGKVGQR